MRRPGLSRRNAGAAIAGAVLWPVSGAAAETVEVEVKDYQYIPAQLTVKVGTTVKWINREKRTTHSILFTGPGGFESERFFPDESWQRTFDKPGSYPYSCGPHPEMKGQIDVRP